MHNGIDIETFKPMPEIERRPRLLMATASADAPLKGLRYLLKAYAALLANYPDLELLLVSKPQPGGKTEQMVKTLGIADRVRFINGISTKQMVSHYAEATIAVIPSIYEGFGLPAGEAMACGVPVVATDGGALPEVVGEAGVIVPTRSVDGLVSAITDLLENPERRAALGERGRARIVEQFCWQVCARQMANYYQRVLRNANG